MRELLIYSAHAQIVGRCGLHREGVDSRIAVITILYCLVVL